MCNAICLYYVSTLQMNFSRQNSFEQRWADVANILNIVPNNTDMDMVSVQQNPLLQNASLGAQPNGTDFPLNAQMGKY